MILIGFHLRLGLSLKVKNKNKNKLKRTVDLQVVPTVAKQSCSLEATDS